MLKKLNAILMTLVLGGGMWGLPTKAEAAANAVVASNVVQRVRQEERRGLLGLRRRVTEVTTVSAPAAAAVVTPAAVVQKVTVPVVQQAVVSKAVVLETNRLNSFTLTTVLPANVVLTPVAAAVPANIVVAPVTTVQPVVATPVAISSSCH